jgi:hypothetical protein
MAGLGAAQAGRASVGSERERLVGAWSLVHIDSPTPDGRQRETPQPVGMLIYTQDGHVSVQLMYPRAMGSLSNEYVKDGYEASFGSYAVDEATHTVTHHVEGSITEGLLGKALPRAFEFSGGRLIVRSTRAEERWSVTWEHY